MNGLIKIDLQTYTTRSKTTSNILSYQFQNGDPVIMGNVILSKTNITTNESGLTDSFSVVLDSQPTSDVFISISSSDLTEGIVNSNQMIFNSSNWNIPQFVVVSGVNDSLLDGNISYKIILGNTESSDVRFNNIDVGDINAINNDNDTAAPGISVFILDRTTTSESGQYSTISIKLKSQPASEVIIPVRSSDLSEGITNVDQLVFTPLNWNIGQKVITTGVDDNILDGNIRYKLKILPAISEDDGYNGKDATDIGLTNYDNEKPLSYPNYDWLVLNKSEKIKFDIFNAVDLMKNNKFNINIS